MLHHQVGDADGGRGTYSENIANHDTSIGIFLFGGFDPLHSSANAAFDRIGAHIIIDAGEVLHLDAAKIGEIEGAGVGSSTRRGGAGALKGLAGVLRSYDLGGLVEVAEEHRKLLVRCVENVCDAVAEHEIFGMTSVGERSEREPGVGRQGLRPVASAGSGRVRT